MIKAYSESDKLNFIPDEYKKDKRLLNFFVRGFFEHAGNINFGNILNPKIECVIQSSNTNVVNEIYNLYDIKPSHVDLKSGVLCYEDLNAKDFLYKIYSEPDARCINNKMYNKYIKIMTSYENSKIPFCRFVKENESAVVPTKNRASNIGYDLTIIKKIKSISFKTAIYDTFIKVQPCFGYYMKVVPNISLSKTGYILSNSIEFVDPNYSETLKIVLTKIDNTLPEIKLPFTCCQLIMEKAIHYEMEESEFLEK